MLVLVVEADGGSRGNPGVAGYGALVREAPDGAVLSERAAPLGKASNNVAEYSGLIAGLEAAIRIGDRRDEPIDVLVRMDSKLVIEQMAGRWKIKHEDMRRLALEATELCRAIRSGGGSVRFEWIPREQNKAADKLSNDGMDGQTVDRDLEEGDSVESRRSDTSVPAAQADSLVATGPAVPAATPPDLGHPTRLVLVRHAVTGYTSAGRLDGRGGADPELDATGVAQAQSLARVVAELVAGSPQPVRVVTSGLARAKATGAAIAAALGVDEQHDDDWDERALGEWDGLTMGRIAVRHGHDLLRLRTDEDFAPPGGESAAQVRTRVRAGYAKAVRRRGTTVVVAHGLPIRLVLADLLGMDYAHQWRLDIAPASLSLVDVWADGNASVRFLNRPGA